LDTVL